MDTKNILSQLRAERARIDQAIAALETLASVGGRGRRRRGSAGPGKAPITRRRRRMSAATRKRLSEMMKKRWAARKKAKGA
jgi:hypothetical protein